MPFNLPLAVKLGRFVQDAYNMQGLADPSKVRLSDPTYTLINVVYGDDKWDSVDGFVPFGFIAQSASAPYNLVVSLRGTENLWDWLADAAFVRTACPASGAPNGAETEDGFTKLYQTLRTVPANAIPLKNTVQALIATLGPANVAQVYVCGHSLGGALATLAAVDLAGAKIVASPSIYTFASPLVGEKTFASWYDGLVPDSYRIYNLPDIVPTLPPTLFEYTHVDEPYQINSGSSVQNSILCHHSLATYLHSIDPTQPLDPACAAVLALPAAPVAVGT